MGIPNEEQELTEFGFESSPPNIKEAGKPSKGFLPFWLVVVAATMMYVGFLTGRNSRARLIAEAIIESFKNDSNSN